MTTKVLSTKLDDDSERALNHLKAATGKTSSALVRDLLREADRERILAQAEAESRALAADPAYLAEIREVQAIMEPLRAR